MVFEMKRRLVMVSDNAHFGNVLAVKLNILPTIYNSESHENCSAISMTPILPSNTLETSFKFP